MKKLLLIFFLLFSLYSCKDKKDDPKPAKPPHKSANTMTCLVNGKEWKNSFQIYPSSIGAQYFEGDYFDLDALSHNNIPGEIYFKVYGLKDTGVYDLGGNSPNYAQCNAYYMGNKLIQYLTDSTHTGFLKVTEFDYPNRKISGFFEFEAFNKDSNDVILITKGEFYKVTFLKF